MNAHIFSPEALSKIVSETLPADAKPGTKAVVGTVDEHGVQVVASFKKNDTWVIQAAARHDWDGTNSLGAKVLLQW
jgi:hypothetical protein